MLAIVVEGKDQPVVWKEVPEPTLKGGEVIVTMAAAAMNHRDVFITQGLYPKIEYPAILGSDGAGFWDERPVIINPSLDWGNDPRFPGKGYQILGMPKHGTFAQRMAVSPDQLYDKPPHLSMAEAAALPLAGLTAYRALFTKGQVQPGERVLITGIGGGVALTACQFALAAGGQVYVTSGSDEKIEKARTLGAVGGANYREEGWDQTLADLTGGFDLIVDSAGGDGFARLIKLCRPGARLVTYGGTRGTVPKWSPQIVFWRQLTILGTSMGNDAEFESMLKLVTEHQITPVVDGLYSPAEAAAVFRRMEEGKQFGKIVFSIPV